MGYDDMPDPKWMARQLMIVALGVVRAKEHAGWVAKTGGDKTERPNYPLNWVAVSIASENAPCKYCHKPQSAGYVNEDDNAFFCYRCGDKFHLLKRMK